MHQSNNSSEGADYSKIAETMSARDYFLGEEKKLIE